MVSFPCILRVCTDVIKTSVKSLVLVKIADGNVPIFQCLLKAKSPSLGLPKKKKTFKMEISKDHKLLCTHQYLQGKKKPSHCVIVKGLMPASKLSKRMIESCVS